jgi:Prokaryotic Cytochrome C oxidase subunit IV
MAVLRLRVTAIWVLLVLATGISWDAMEGLSWISNTRVGTAIVVGVAFLKARFIMLDFMELRAAPIPLRVFAEIWAFGLSSALIVMYLCLESHRSHVKLML